jgi:hypothetical protein
MRRSQNRQVTFWWERGYLMRQVATISRTSKAATTYVQRASLAAFQEVAWYMADKGRADGATTGELWDFLTDIPATQVSVALDFLVERGIVVKCGRRNYPASMCLYEDAMTEFYALEHEAKTGERA